MEIEQLLKLAERISSDIDLIWGFFVTISLAIIALIQSEKAKKQLFTPIVSVSFCFYSIVGVFLFLKYEALKVIVDQLSSQANGQVDVIKAVFSSGLEPNLVPFVMAIAWIALTVISKFTLNRHK
ncbi:hypothetical protein LRP52_27515 [Photobacterium sp. ZSDE20]|uniref:Uncharacterized protein n=1 Tax=Photobacterium pectinilyticum TaxID=2906793 RepID=A0ABT1N4Q3_9GAMM|nr:hypothetical protein [Photobacterium sp. ZSDE20]MCQ1059723.1 hypothetical protein [Photobacterium sp. ZSDE20]MDD1825929.1 hypothetical protein [Photobacterium sp. ZSDE20]